MSADVIPFHRADPDVDEPLDPFQRDLAEARAALLLVAEGTATRVTLSGLPNAAEIAPFVIEAGRQQGVDVQIERRPRGLVVLFIGPKTAHE